MLVIFAAHSPVTTDPWFLLCRGQQIIAQGKVARPPPWDTRQKQDHLPCKGKRILQCSQYSTACMSARLCAGLQAVRGSPPGCARVSSRLCAGLLTPHTRPTEGLQT